MKAEILHDYMEGFVARAQGLGVIKNDEEKAAMVRMMAELAQVEFDDTRVQRGRDRIAEAILSKPEGCDYFVLSLENRWLRVLEDGGDENVDLSRVLYHEFFHLVEHTHANNDMGNECAAELFAEECFGTRDKKQWSSYSRPVIATRAVLKNIGVPVRDFVRSKTAFGDTEAKIIDQKYRAFYHANHNDGKGIDGFFFQLKHLADDLSLHASMCVESAEGYWADFMDQINKTDTKQQRKAATDKKMAKLVAELDAAYKLQVLKKDVGAYLQLNVE